MSVFNNLTVQFDRESKAIQFFLGANLVYDIGIEFCQSPAQIEQWISQLQDKRWIRENDGVTLFLQSLAAIRPTPMEALKP